MNVHPSVSFRFGSALAMVVTARMMVARSSGALAVPARSYTPRQGHIRAGAALAKPFQSGS